MLNQTTTQSHVLPQRVWDVSGNLHKLSLTEQPRVERPLCPSCMSQCQETIRGVGAKYSLRAWDLDDFTQDTWLAVLAAAADGRYDPRRGQLANWLHVVAHNRAVTLFRRKQRSARAVVDVPLDLLPSRFADDPAALAARGAEIQQLRAALARLAQRISPLGYAIFYLRRIGQHTVAEVAANLKLTPDQVRAHDHRARRKLAQLMVVHPPAAHAHSAHTAPPTLCRWTAD